VSEKPHKTTKAAVTFMFTTDYTILEAELENTLMASG
jgi:hypothetical protein